MSATAKTSAPTTRAPASQRGDSAVIDNPGDPIVKTSLTDLLREELGEEPERPEENKIPSKKTRTPAQAARDADPEDDESLDDESEPEASAEDAESEEDTAPDAEDSTEETENTEGETEETEETDEESEELDENSPKVPKALQKRFHKLTSERNELRAQVTDLERQLSAKPAAAATSFEAQVQAVRSPSELERLRTQFEQWEELAISNPEGLQIPGKDGAEATTYSAEQMRALLVNTRRALRAMPARERFLEEKKAKDTEALRAYPAYQDPDSSLAKAYAAVVERAPGLEAAVPDLKLFVADALRGRALRTKAAKTDSLPGRPIAREKTPPSGGRSSAPARATTPVASELRSRRANEALARVEKSGHVDDLAEALEARFG